MNRPRSLTQDLPPTRPAARSAPGSGVKSRLEELCLERGLRMNAKRRLILDVFEKARGHPSVDDIHREIGLRTRSISLATVYRTLGILTDAGVLKGLEFGDGRIRYELADHENHDHLIDVQSGHVLEIQDQAIRKILAHAASRLGYTLLHYHLELFAESQTSGVANVAIDHADGALPAPIAGKRRSPPNSRTPLMRLRMRNQSPESKIAKR